MTEEGKKVELTEEEKMIKEAEKRKKKVEADIKSIKNLKDVKGLSKEVHNNILNNLLDSVFIEENIDDLLVIMRKDLLKENRRK